MSKILFYKPRQSLYYVLHDDALIKTPEGEWVKGRVYMEMGGAKVYARPLSMFKPEKWEELTSEQASERLRAGI